MKDVLNMRVAIFNKWDPEPGSEPGAQCTLGEFLRDNNDGITVEDAAEITAAMIGHHPYKGGGGAEGGWWLVRSRAAPKGWDAIEAGAEDIHPGWSSADAAAVEGEGWNVFENGSTGDLEIQADAEYTTFVRDGCSYDGEALAYVQKRAAEGSEVHQRALAAVAELPDDEPFTTEPTEQGLQFVIPGCEHDQSRGPEQMDLLK